MNQGNRLEKLKEMAARFPDDPRARYFLAHELFRVEDWEGAAEQLIFQRGRLTTPDWFTK